MSNERSPRGLCSTTIGISGMVSYPFDNCMVVEHDSNQPVVKEAAMSQALDHEDEARGGAADEEPRQRVRRAVDVDASPEEVFEALITEDGRRRWLEDPDREIHI